MTRLSSTRASAPRLADLVLLMVDASFGFDMGTFEFLNFCQVGGQPRRAVRRLMRARPHAHAAARSTDFRR